MTMMDTKFPHRGITMHRLPVGGDFPGLLFAVGCALIFLLAIPALWCVLVGAVAVGVFIAGVLQIIRHSHESRPNEKILFR
jgi:hypothetical protein